MKTCACCRVDSDAATCPNCGEASWLAIVTPESKPATKPATRKRGKTNAPDDGADNEGN